MLGDIDWLSAVGLVYALVPCGTSPVATGYGTRCRRGRGPHKSGAVAIALSPVPLEHVSTVDPLLAPVVLMQHSEV